MKETLTKPCRQTLTPTPVLPPGEDKSIISLSSENQKRYEAEAFIRLHGYSMEDACELVCISVEDYLSVPISPQSKLDYLPTPEMIAELCEEIRSRDTPEIDALRAGGCCTWEMPVIDTSPKQCGPISASSD